MPIHQKETNDIGGELCDVKINFESEDTPDNGHHNHYPQIHANNNRRLGHPSDSNENTNAELHMSML